jgi:hypothetical protein
VLDEILQERVAPRRNRRNHRGVKRKMSNFPLRRKGQPPPQPFDPIKAIQILK